MCSVPIGTVSTNKHELANTSMHACTLCRSLEGHRATDHRQALSDVLMRSDIERGGQSELLRGNIHLENSVSVCCMNTPTDHFFVSSNTLFLVSVLVLLSTDT